MENEERYIRIEHLYTALIGCKGLIDLIKEMCAMNREELNDETKRFYINLLKDCLDDMNKIDVNRW